MLVVDVSFSLCVSVFSFIQAISLNHFHSVESIIFHDDVDLPFIFISRSLSHLLVRRKRRRRRSTSIHRRHTHTHTHNFGISRWLVFCMSSLQKLLPIAKEMTWNGCELILMRIWKVCRLILKNEANRSDGSTFSAGATRITLAN